MTKLKSTNCDKPKTSNRDKTKKNCIETKISKTQTVTKSKISNWDKTQKHKLQLNSITQIATKTKNKMMSKLKKNN